MDHFHNQPYLGKKTYGHIVLPEFNRDGFDCRPILRIFSLLVSKSQNQTDRSLISQFSDLQASDPKDKVYGLLGLVNTTVAPDYQKSTEEVYLEVCRVWINEVQDLQFSS